MVAEEEWREVFVDILMWHLQSGVLNITKRQKRTTEVPDSVVARGIGFGWTYEK